MYLYSHYDTACKLVKLVYIKTFPRCDWKLFVVNQCRIFNYVLIGIVHFLVKIIPELANTLFSSAEDKTKEMRCPSSDAQGANMFSNIKIPKQTSIFLVCFYIFVSWSITIFQLTKGNHQVISSSWNAT